VELIKQLGFDGKSVINPRQIPLVNQVYTPSPDEIKKSVNVIRAEKETEERGLGVISLNGKMIDKPIVDRAERVLQLATAVGLYKEEVEDEK